MISIYYELFKAKRLLEKAFHLDNLFTKSREHIYIRPREIFDYLAIKHLKFTTTLVGKISNRHYASVLNSYKKVERLQDIGAYEYNDIIDYLKKEIVIRN